MYKIVISRDRNSDSFADMTVSDLDTARLVMQALSVPLHVRAGLNQLDGVTWVLPTKFVLGAFFMPDTKKRK